MKELKVLVLDIEVSPLLVYVWQLKQQFVGLPQVVKDWCVMAWCAKWLNKPSSLVYYDNRNNKGTNDKAILKPLWKMLNEADVILTQNGKEFDAKKINARFMLNGMKPPKPYVHYDTYQIVSKVAAFTSNSLAYLTSKFCITHKKLTHRAFPGLMLWIECLKGNKAAWDEMKTYNIEDVLSTEELYLKIKAWSPASLPKLFPMTDAASQCGRCGYKGQMREGKPRQAKTYSYRQNSCPKCGAWQDISRIKEKGK